MESACALPIIPFSPNPKPRLSRTLRTKASSSSSFHHSISFAGNSLRPSPVLPAVASRGLASFSCSASLSGSSGGGGGDELFPSGGGGGGGGGEALGDTTGVSGSGSDNVIILSVGGMSCGGCAASVKRILESQYFVKPQVSSATVEFEKEMAIIWVVPETKALGSWQKELGEKLANQLTSCGFKSHLYEGQAAEGDFQS
ncbi:putative copper-transporting ATPase PAA1, chloroplastic [Iris pallida]|uniref:Copper-transporting ATPase PAA1, chloroplastic n=1 Tax=Iris pallida TaxID=29817 RepID=A0AAX6HNI7_IRIPA|nr:putative copper-transporting ATPase PAA1, chloroplastic [Iris pallida]